MINKKKILAISLLLLLTIVGYSSYSYWLKSEAQATVISNKEIKPTDFQGIEMIIETKETNDYSISLTYPKVANEQLNTLFQTFVDQKQEDFLTNFKTEKTSNLVISMDIFNSLANMKTIVLHTTSSGDHTNSTDVQIFMLDENLTKTITMNDILDISKLAPKNEKNLIDSTNVKLLNDIFSKAYVTEQSFVFLNTQNCLEVPLTELVSALKEPYLSLIDTPEPEEPKKQVALTFDDGPHPTYTKNILETLHKYNAKATFFMLGKSVERNPLIAQKVAKAGHEIGNHSWFHENLTKLSVSSAVDNLNRTNDKIQEVTGIYPTLYRPPFGSINDHLEAAIPMEKVMWTIDTKDWKSKNTEAIMNIIKTHLEDDAIILLHDIHEETAQSLDTILSYIQEQGYECVTISELNK